MRRVILTNAERDMVVHALNVAAEQFEKDAATVAKEFGPNGRTVAQFQKQATDSRNLAEKIEYMEVHV